LPPAIAPYALNEEMMAAGVGIFVGGLRPASSARSLRVQGDGKVLVTDGPYLETKEHVGGFWVLEAADLDAALAWGRKAAIACRAPVECARFTDGGGDVCHPVCSEACLVYAFDTLGYSKRLRDAGVPQLQAEAHAEAAGEFVMAELVTKTDIQTLTTHFDAKLDNLSLRLTIRLQRFPVIWDHSVIPYDRKAP
jgi:hypothetical protein